MREKSGFSVVRQAVTIAVFNSIEDQLATATWSQVGSVETAARYRE